MPIEECKCKECLIAKYNAEGISGKHEGCRRGFHRSSKAWYYQKEQPVEIMFGMYAYGGGTTGEMAMRWLPLDNKMIPRLEIFNDSWDALNTFQDLLIKLAERDGDNITEDEFAIILLECGFEDLTKYKSP
jgi:hypothetical protein